MARAPKGPKEITTLNHGADARRNIPTAELADLAAMQEEMAPVQPVAFPRARPLAQGEVRERDEDLDPQIVWNGARIRLTKAQVQQLAETGEIEIGDAQLVWRGKDRQDWSDLIVTAPPLYIQEKVHPKAIIDDLVRQSRVAKAEASEAPDLFADFNGLPDPMARTEFYQHDQHWSNRMILGDSLQVMASLAERETLKGKVQAIYFDPPYGIKFGSNWQVSTRSTKVDDKKQTDISREPEQVKAFRDTWKDNIHSYLTYLRDRLTVMRELLTESGSIFLQMGDENVHRVRSILDEVFGEQNYVSLISYRTSVGLGSKSIDNVANYILWYAKDVSRAKYRPALNPVQPGKEGASRYKKIVFPDGSVRPATEDELANPFSIEEGGQLFRDQGLTSRTGSETIGFAIEYRGRKYTPKTGGWRTGKVGIERVKRASRLLQTGDTLSFEKRFSDFSCVSIPNFWADVSGGITSRADPKIYVVQTATSIVQRCLLMATDPGDLVLDPTCGSGTTAYVAEQWGRRWVTIDTSRVALALARTRIMSSRYPWYLLADSADGKRKEAEITGKPPSERAAYGDVRQGFVYERVPHVTLKSIANNAEIDVIWDKWKEKLEPLRDELNQITGNNWQEWEIPREAAPGWSSNVVGVHKAWWAVRIARQREIDASIARSADVEYLYDKPYADPNRVRVAGPFTVESLSPHRIVPSDAEELLDVVDAADGKKKRGPLSGSETDFAAMVLEHLKTAGVHQTDKADRISFTSLMPFAGRGYIGAEGRFMEGETERRAAIFIGPEFGTLSRVDLTAAAREAAESRFDVLIAVSFAFDAHASELTRLGPLPILKAKMNPDLHMAGELKNTGKGNLFTIFGEPDIDILEQPDGRIAVRVNGVDIYDPNTGEVRSNDVKGIAAWFIDTAYNEESFFVRHAYFLGANDPYKQLKTTLKAEIDEDAWATLYRNTSRPFDRPESGRIAVKVINHFGDEVMKVFGV
ncbi:MAG: site-specific DNA-methyltransferase [Sphingomonadales bacterium 28-64-96]|nr:MAG: site-specific DNA-methyltransferase [Sphingomonadales bacterium 28-64-96]